MQSDPASAHDELVERMVSAMLDADNALPHSGPDFAAYARAALAVASPVIMEECARVAEDYDGPGMVGGYDRHLGDGYETRRDIAAAIRAMIKEKNGE